MKNQLNKKDKKNYEKEIKSSTEIIKKIDTLIAKYLGTIDKRQGITRNPEITVSQRFNVARRYVSSRFGAQTSTEKTLIKHLKEALEKALKQTKTFLNSDWKKYRENCEKIKLSPFKAPAIYLIK
jgi:hypothetical protein